MNTIPNLPAPLLHPTRRHVIEGIVAVLGGLSAPTFAGSQARQPAMEEKPSNPANAARTSIHYDLDFTPAPQRLYAAILDQKQFAAFSGMPATIDPAPGGAFSMFGGLIVGRNVELVPDRRIVQAWRPTHWDDGVYSIVHFEIKPRSAESTLIFDHTGFPAGDYDHLDWGWNTHYWDPLRKFLS